MTHQLTQQEPTAPPLSDDARRILAQAYFYLLQQANKRRADQPTHEPTESAPVR